MRVLLARLALAVRRVRVNVFDAVVVRLWDRLALRDDVVRVLFLSLERLERD